MCSSACAAARDTDWTFADLAQSAATSPLDGRRRRSAGTRVRVLRPGRRRGRQRRRQHEQGLLLRRRDRAARDRLASPSPPSARPWTAGSLVRTGVIVDGPSRGDAPGERRRRPMSIPFAPGTGPTINDDGIHTVVAPGSNGGSATTIVAIDAHIPCDQRRVAYRRCQLLPGLEREPGRLHLHRCRLRHQILHRLACPRYAARDGLDRYEARSRSTRQTTSVRRQRAS